MVAVLTFVLQQHLPYRKMLITTGIPLGVVLEVMVGKQAQEMQLAHWISRTDIGWLTNVIPAWMGMWFALFPLTRRWLLNYWPRSWSWALTMPQLTCSAEHDRTIAIRQTQPQPVRAFPKSLLITNRWYYLFSKTLQLFSRGEGFRSLHFFERTD
jgi:hypothetical protein